MSSIDRPAASDAAKKGSPATGMPAEKSVAPGGKVEYRDRPADDGKHGDGRQEPNTGSPRQTTPCKD